VYVGPGSSVLAASSTPFATSVQVKVDLYATMRFTVARAVAGYVVGKVTPQPLALRGAIESCVKDLMVTGRDVEEPPAFVDVVHDVVHAGASCRAAVNSLTRDPAPTPRLASDVSKEVKGFSKGLALKVPAEVWSDLLRAAAQVLRRG
jgi:hypothetical protein